MIVITAGTRVHAGHKHKRTRIGNAIFGSGNIYNPVFQRLTEYLQSATLELGQLVAEKHTVVSQTYLAGLWI
jgi:hypothetical protein